MITSFISLLKGQEKAWKAFWIWNILFSFITGFIYVFFLTYSVLLGDGFSIVIIIFCCIYLVTAIGLWRCAFNLSGWTGWGILYRIFALFYIIGIILSLIDYMKISYFITNIPEVNPVTQNGVSHQKNNENKSLLLQCENEMKTFLSSFSSKNNDKLSREILQSITREYMTLCLNNDNSRDDLRYSFEKEAKDIVSNAYKPKDLFNDCHEKTKDYLLQRLKKDYANKNKDELQRIANNHLTKCLEENKSVSSDYSHEFILAERYDARNKKEVEEAAKACGKIITTKYIEDSSLSDSKANSITRENFEQAFEQCLIKSSQNPHLTKTILLNRDRLMNMDASRSGKIDKDCKAKAKLVSIRRAVEQLDSTITKEEKKKAVLRFYKEYYYDCINSELNIDMSPMLKEDN